MTSSTHRLPGSAAHRNLTPVETAARRLAHAEAAQAAAERAEEHVDNRIVAHGGPAYCSPALIAQLMRAHERVFVAGVDVRRWQQRLAVALVAENGGLG